MTYWKLTEATSLVDSYEHPWLHALRCRSESRTKYLELAGLYTADVGGNQLERYNPRIFYQEYVYIYIYISNLLYFAMHHNNLSCHAWAFPFTQSYMKSRVLSTLNNSFSCVSLSFTVGYMITKKTAKLLLRMVLPAHYPIDDQTAYLFSEYKMKAFMVKNVNVQHLGALTNNEKAANRWKSNIWASKFGDQIKA